MAGASTLGTTAPLGLSLLGMVAPSMHAAVLPAAAPLVQAFVRTLTTAATRSHKGTHRAPFQAQAQQPQAKELRRKHSGAVPDTEASGPAVLRGIKIEHSLPISSHPLVECKCAGHRPFCHKGCLRLVPCFASPHTPVHWVAAVPSLPWML